MDLQFNKQDIKRDQKRLNDIARDMWWHRMKMLFGEGVFDKSKVKKVEKMKNEKVYEYIHRDVLDRSIKGGADNTSAHREANNAAHAWRYGKPKISATDLAKEYVEKAIEGSIK